jgi:hypothetical protein
MNRDPLVPCPCCGLPAFTEPDSYEICAACGWEDDRVQAADPDFAGGANDLSLVQSREIWLANPVPGRWRRR